MQSLGITLVLMIVAAVQEAPSSDDGAPQDVRAAVGRSLPFLEREGVAWKETRGCTSCHHVPMMIWTHHEAEEHGFTIDKTAVEEAESWALGQYLKHPEFMPTGQDKSFPRRGPGPGSVYLALGVGAAGHKDGPSAEALGKFSGHFAGIQEGDGSWAIKQSTPPLVDGDDVATLLILLAMDGTDTDAVGQARRKALEWLGRAPCRDETQPLALRAMVAARFGRGDEAQKSAARLRGRQNGDGGWSQVEGRGSDALATGQALCALAAAGEEPESPAIRRARRFLLDSQREDGSWLVRTRTPRGHDEIVTYYGTGWATIGLIRSLPDRPGGE
jgi:squalene-hopene/tetraprenyl-beta-curcumene cyclase